MHPFKSLLFCAFLGALPTASWSETVIRILDNFEWACGYRPTFGLVKVDFDTLQRIPKDSYLWYRNFIRHGDVARPRTASTQR
jgi:hypothetical protein